jgi:hypothetical protein
MRAREKASELVMIYYNQICDLIVVTDGITRSNRFKIVKPKAKQCALIAVDEMMHMVRFNLFYNYEKHLEYWQQVKTEIEKL